MFSELAPEFCFDLLEVEWLKTCSGTTVDPGLVPNDLGSQRLWEAADGLTKITLEELDNRRREVQLVSAFQNILLRELIGGQPLGKVTNNLG